MEAPADSALRFGPFTLDLRTGELSRGTTRVRLQDQPFEILRLMLERPGQVVTRDALRRRLWPDGTFVDFEHSLNAAIKRLRAALGDAAENPRFVETLPRRGYRFIAPLAADPPGAVAAPRPAAPPALSRLAVLPFADLTDDADAYFSAGLTEEMIAQLGRQCRGRVAVLARTSCMVFRGTALRAREIGETLRADYLLEGSVRREGSRVRIAAQLVETASETHLWSETYERDLSECCGSAAAGSWSVQADVATLIARSLTAELAYGDRTPQASMAPPEAYQAFLKGRYYWNLAADRGLDEAIVYFEQATAAAPGFAAAHGALARALVGRAEYYRSPPRPELEAALTAAERALALDPALCEAHVARADAGRMLAWNWQAAEVGYAQAQALNPSYVGAYRRFAVMLAGLARHDDAVRASERAFELDPLCLDAGATAAWVRYAAGDFDAAIDYCRNTLDMDPSYVPARRLLGAAVLLAGRPDEARDELRVAVEKSGEGAVDLLWLAHATAAAGCRSDAEPLLARALALDRYVPAYHVALAYTGLGDHDAALAALDQAFRDRDPAVGGVAVEPRFEPLRSTPRFTALVSRLGLS